MCLLDTTYSNFYHYSIGLRRREELPAHSLLPTLSTFTIAYNEMSFNVGIVGILMVVVVIE